MFETKPVYECWRTFCERVHVCPSLGKSRFIHGTECLHIRLGKERIFLQCVLKRHDNLVGCDDACAGEEVVIAELVETTHARLYLVEPRKDRFATRRDFRNNGFFEVENTLFHFANKTTIHKLVHFAIVEEAMQNL